jgi:hypothetical protein
MWNENLFWFSGRCWVSQCCCSPSGRSRFSLIRPKSTIVWTVVGATTTNAGVVTMKRLNFAPASNSEQFVYGAQRPGYQFRSSIPDTEVDQWVEFMRQQGVTRVCCLLPVTSRIYLRQQPVALTNMPSIMAPLVSSRMEIGLNSEFRYRNGRLRIQRLRLGAALRSDSETYRGPTRCNLRLFDPASHNRNSHP